MQTALFPGQILYRQLKTPQGGIQPAITEPLRLDLCNKFGADQRNIRTSYLHSLGDSPTDTSDWELSSGRMDQPLDLSPSSSPPVRTSPQLSSHGNILSNALNILQNGFENKQEMTETTVVNGSWMVTRNVPESMEPRMYNGQMSPPSSKSGSPVSNHNLSLNLMLPSPTHSSCSDSPSLSPEVMQLGGEALGKRYKYEPILPPCQVCGDNASGYHYGANTCEACKAFFRRALQRKTKFKCVTGGNCEVRQGRGFTCAFCRFQRCNQLGMSLTAIKRGRYTHAKKAENIREVKRLQQMRHGDVQMVLCPMNDNIQQDISPQTNTVKPQLLAQQYTKVPTLEPLSPQKAELKNGDISKALRCKEEELDALVKEVSDNHGKFFGDFSEMRSKLPVIEAEYLEQRRQREKLFGKIPTLPFSEYQQIWNETGVDVDGRQEILVDKLLPSIQKTITKIIQFARTLPGFCQLSCQDQVALIKGSRTENWFIGEHRCYNTREGLYTSSVRCETVDMDDMAKVAGSLEVVQAIFKIATRLQQCYLTDEEVSLYKAVAIMQRDRTDSGEGADICEESQNKLMEALQYLVIKNHPNDPSLLARMLMILTDLRSIERQKGEELAKMCMINLNQRFPPAVLQFMNLAPLE